MYAIRPHLPAVCGEEGVGVVTRVGTEVTSFEEGDWVIPAVPGLGMQNVNGEPLILLEVILKERGAPSWFLIVGIS